MASVGVTHLIMNFTLQMFCHAKYIDALAPCWTIVDQLNVHFLNLIKSCIILHIYYK